MFNKRILHRPLGHQVDILVVGGGGGAGCDMGGGGGAGGFLSTVTASLDDRRPLEKFNYRNGNTPSTASLMYGETYDIVIGAGGAGAPGGSGTRPSGSDGSLSYFTGSNSIYPLSLIAYGGGGGGSDHDNEIAPSPHGASGGGAGGRDTVIETVFIDGQGFQGGTSIGAWYPASGGGAGGPGKSNAADGGVGRRFDILGTEYWWSGGGAGAGYSNRAGNGGKGGGGGGAPRVSGGGFGDTNGLNNGSDAQTGNLNSQTNKTGGNGGANTGGGGGGGSHYSSGNGGTGGSGCVVLVMTSASYSGVHTGTPIVQSGSLDGSAGFSHVALIFTQSGTYTAITGSRLN